MLWGGWGSDTQKCVDQKWPVQIFPIANFDFPTTVTSRAPDYPPRVAPQLPAQLPAAKGKMGGNGGEWGKMGKDGGEWGDMGKI